MKTTDITPQPYLCAIGLCPAVFKTDRGTLLVVGKRRQPEECSAQVKRRVGPDEEVVEVPIGLIRDLVRQSLD